MLDLKRAIKRIYFKVCLIDGHNNGNSGKQGFLKKMVSGTAAMSNFKLPFENGPPRSFYSLGVDYLLVLFAALVERKTTKFLYGSNNLVHRLSFLTMLNFFFSFR